MVLAGLNGARGASRFASAAINAGGFIDFALVAVLLDGFNGASGHAGAATNALFGINLVGHGISLFGW